MSVMRTIPFILACFILLSVFPPLAPIVAAKDITDQVIRETELDEQIAQLCSDYCLGTGRQGRLTSVLINRIEGNLYFVMATATLRSRNEGVISFDHTSVITAEGVLDGDTCALRIDNVEIENDFQNLLTNLLRKHADLVGTVRTILDCGRFLE